MSFGNTFADFISITDDYIHIRVFGNQFHCIFSRTGNLIEFPVTQNAVVPRVFNDMIHGVIIGMGLFNNYTNRTIKYGP